MQPACTRNDDPPKGAGDGSTIAREQSPLYVLSDHFADINEMVLALCSLCQSYDFTVQLKNQCQDSGQMHRRSKRSSLISKHLQRFPASISRQKYRSPDHQNAYTGL